MLGFVRAQITLCGKMPSFKITADGVYYVCGLQVKETLL